MSAAEIIELIKKLPPEEQAEVQAYARNMPTSPEVRCLPQEEAKRIADRVFSEHHELFQRLAQ